MTEKFPSPQPAPTHTPGPLEAVGHMVRTARNEDGSGGYLVAECSVLQPRRDADARLFAAAPELLEACLAIDEWNAREQDHAIDFNSRVFMCLAACDKVSAAIAKATGEPA